jgi:hypothetical protein
MALDTLMHANTQWSSRPADQRFLSLDELRATTSATRQASRSGIMSTRQLQVMPAESDPMHGIQVQGSTSLVTPTHWAFGQLAALAKAPAGYLRTLPAPLVADAMNYGLRFNRDAEDVGVLATRTDDGVELRAATGPGYGRIWNDDIVSALQDRFGDGRTGNFRVPGEFGKQVEVTKANTTIYGSDRDIFVFLADEENRVEMDNRRNGQGGSLARGFFVWNSEVGSQSIGAAFFLFDYVCKNRIVWGVEGFKEMRLRHTKSAPDRWLEEVTPVLMEYSAASAKPIEATIAAAQEKKLGDDLAAFMAKRFTRPETTAILAAHEREEGRPVETVWDAVTAVTAHAKSITYQDERVAMERKGGALLDLVAA